MYFVVNKLSLQTCPLSMQIICSYHECLLTCLPLKSNKRMYTFTLDQHETQLKQHKLPVYVHFDICLNLSTVYLSIGMSLFSIRLVTVISIRLEMR